MLDRLGIIHLIIGPYAVTSFFALSGFLITYLLLKERAETNHINIPFFYVRRVLRIWPLYFLYLILVIIYLVLFDQLPAVKSILYYVFFIPNISYILRDSINYANHYWSIGVEEQFYLFWPYLLLRKNPMFFFILIIITWNFLKIWLYYIHPDQVLFDFFHVTRFDCMAIGGIFAYLFFHKGKFFDWINNFKIFKIVSYALYLATLFNLFYVNKIFNHAIIAAATCFIILDQINKKNLINLDKKILDTIGKISFGVYIYHSLVIMLIMKLISYFALEGLWYNGFVIIFSILFTLLIAQISFYYLESKILKLRYKYNYAK